MRPIDADALEPHEQLEPMGNGRYEYVQIVYKDDIDATPTIEPERKKGEWMFEEYPDGYYHSHCSECEAQFPEEAYIQRWHFCPNCGAWMKEGGE